MFGGDLRAWALAAILLAVALWHVAYRRVDHADGEAGSGVR
jgi:hypothetical protein